MEKYTYETIWFCNEIKDKKWNFWMSDVLFIKNPSKYSNIKIFRKSEESTIVQTHIILWVERKFLKDIENENSKIEKKVRLSIDLDWTEI